MGKFQYFITIAYVADIRLRNGWPWVCDLFNNLRSFHKWVACSKIEISQDFLHNVWSDCTTLLTATVLEFGMFFTRAGLNIFSHDPYPPFSRFVPVWYLGFSAMPLIATIDMDRLFVLTYPVDYSLADIWRRQALHVAAHHSIYHARGGLTGIQNRPWQAFLTPNYTFSLPSNGPCMSLWDLLGVIMHRWVRHTFSLGVFEFLVRAWS